MKLKGNSLGVIFDEFYLPDPLREVMQHCAKQKKPVVLDWHRPLGQTARDKKDFVGNVFDNPELWKGKK